MVALRREARRRARKMAGLYRLFVQKQRQKTIAYGKVSRICELAEGGALPHIWRTFLVKEAELWDQRASVRELAAEMARAHHFLHVERGYGLSLLTELNNLRGRHLSMCISMTQAIAEDLQITEEGIAMLGTIREICARPPTSFPAEQATEATLPRPSGGDLAPSTSV